MTGKRPRRWLRWTASVLLLGVAALAFAGWLFVRDRERVAALVVAQVRESSGLDLVVEGGASLDWLPPGIRLRDVALRFEGKPLLQARELAASVPWRTLWTREPHLSALELVGADVDSDAVTAYLDSRRDDGPPAPLQWPRLDTILVVDDATVRSAGSAPVAFSIRIERLAPELPVNAVVTVKQAEHAVRVELYGTRAAGPGLALDPARLVLSPVGDGATVEFEGKLRFAAASDWRIVGKLACPEIDAWLAAFVPGLPIGKQFELDVDVRRASTLALRAKGAIGDSRVDADLAGIALPADGGAAAWLALATSSALRGSATVDRWQVGEVRLEGIELRAGEEAGK